MFKWKNVLLITFLFVNVRVFAQQQSPDEFLNSYSISPLLITQSHWQTASLVQGHPPQLNVFFINKGKNLKKFIFNFVINAFDTKIKLVLKLNHDLTAPVKFFFFFAHCPRRGSLVRL